MMIRHWERSWVKKSFIFWLISCLIISLLFIWSRSGVTTLDPNAFDPNTFDASTLNPKTWLLATSCGASSVARRMIIRATWQNLYKNLPITATLPITTKFFIGNPDPIWKPVLDFENEMYNDLIILPNIPDDNLTANTIKTLEFFKYLVNTNQKYDYVSKIDDDSYLSVRFFWNQYLYPLIKLGKKGETTIIARFLRREHVKYAGGQFYTLPWNLIPILVNLQDRYKILNLDEDLLVGTLYKKGNVNWSAVNLENPVAFDYLNEANKTACAISDELQDEWYHAVGPKAINPHKMKTDTDYLMVANLFDEKGLKLGCSFSLNAQHELHRQREQ